MNKIKKFLIGASSLAYLGGCIFNSYKATKSVQILREEFKNVAENYPCKIVIKKTSIDGDIKVLDYDGELEKIIKKRNEHFKVKKGIIFNDWYVRDKIAGRCYVICLNPNPYLKFEEYEK